MTDSRDLSLPTTPVHQELTAFVDYKLITIEQKQMLTVAADNLQRMKVSSTPIGERPLNKIDVMLSARDPSPVSKARDALTTFSGSWERISQEFHRYRKMVFEARLRRAKLNKRKNDLEKLKLSEDDRAILEAEIDLESAELEAQESEIARGQTTMKADILAATTASEQYAVICKAAGKESFTEADFRKDEVIYFLKSAWWYASKVFRTIDRRDEWTRPREPPANRREAYQQLMKARENRQIKIKNEVALFFQSLGISQNDIETELLVILRMRDAYDRSLQDQTPLEPFSGYFDSWIQTTANKYQDRAMAALEKDGFSAIKRLSKILNPDPDDEGDDGNVGKMRRGMITE